MAHRACVGAFAIVAVLAAAWTGCASSPSARPTAPVAIPVIAPRAAPGTPIEIERPSASAGTTTVVIRAAGAASRQPERPRVLRRLLAHRKGQIEIARGYARVGLTVSAVVSGALDDPDYAKRPVGTNHLSVVLTDEAAFAAPSSLDGFEGTWTLTRHADGTLVASAIGDTPFPASSVSTRRALLEKTRANLRASSPEERVAGLDVLAQHAFYALVPDVIAVLDDERSDTPPPPPPGGRGHGRRGPRVVGQTADATLRSLFVPLADAALPEVPSPSRWSDFWQDLLSRGAGDAAPLVASTRFELARIAMNQSWPELVATQGGGLAIVVSGMEAPVDGHQAGIALMSPPWEKRQWISPGGEQGIDAAAARSGVGIVSASHGGAWRFTHVPAGPGAPPKGGEIVSQKAQASHSALAASDNGFLVVYVTEAASSLFALPLDATGKPRGPARALPLPTKPAASYHHGVHPLSLARRRGGWLAVLETSSGVLLANLDESLSLVSASDLANVTGIAQPNVAVSLPQDRALVVWTREEGTPKLASVMVDAAGQRLGDVAMTGSEVDRISRPVALEDGGFAVAWIESDSEVHIGRWNAAGVRVASALVQSREVAPFALALVRDGAGLVVAYQDTSRYPFTLVARRIELNALR